MSIKRKIITMVSSVVAAVAIGSSFVSVAASADDLLSIDFNVTYHQTDARNQLADINKWRATAPEYYNPQNELVKAHNTKALIYDYDLEQIAMQRAAELVINYDHEHRRPDGSKCFTCEYNGISSNGENIAMGTNLSSAKVFEGWREDEELYLGQGHRRNMLGVILDPNGNPYLEDEYQFTRIGIACVEYEGVKYWVQEFGFGTPNEVATPANDSLTSVTVNYKNTFTPETIKAVCPYKSSSVSDFIGGTTTVDCVSIVRTLGDFVIEDLTDKSTFTWSVPGTDNVLSDGNTISFRRAGDYKIVGSAEYQGTTININYFIMAYIQQAYIGDASIKDIGTNVSKVWDEEIPFGLEHYYPDQEYVASGVEPEFELTFADYVLEQDVDYTVEFYNNTYRSSYVNYPAYAVLYGAGDKFDSESFFYVFFNIVPANIARAEVTMPQDSYEYTGSAIVPAVTVAMDGTTLVANRDYTVSYSDNEWFGTASITLTGKGNYTGTLEKQFSIVEVPGQHIYDGEYGLKCLGCGEVRDITGNLSNDITYVATDTNDDYIADVMTISGSGYVDGTFTSWPEYFLDNIEEVNVSCEVYNKNVDVFDAFGDKVNVSHDAIDVYEIPATCTSSGTTAGTKCSECGIILSGCENIPKSDHNIVIDVEANASTCTSVGNTEGHHCETCDTQTVESIEIELIDHSIVIDVEAQAPTCTSVGNTEGHHCETCDTQTVIAEELAVIDHTVVVIPSIPATCISTGFTEGSECSVCGTVLVMPQIVNNKPHTPVLDESIDPTCTEEGKTEGYHCGVCGVVLTAQKSIPATGHTEVVIPAVEATCSANGATEGTKCSVCGDIIKAPEVIYNKPHTPVIDEAVEPTCTVDGKTSGYHCSVCGVVLTSQKTIEATGHTVVADPAVAATLNSTGLTAGSHCSVCGTIIVAQQVVAKLVPTSTPTATPTPVPTTRPTQAPTATPTPVPTQTPVQSEEAESGVAGFVERLYTVALGRKSDPVGKQNWINAIKNGETGAEAAKGFLFSAEFLNKDMSNEDFVAVLYRTFFDREPDAAGHAAWVAALERGDSKQDVIMGFINSTEWANVCLKYGIASGGTGTPNIEVEPNENIIAFATRLYTTCLNRDPDQNGLMAWARQLANLRDSGTNAAHGFFFSGEFEGQNLDNEEYVTRLYRTFMGREPDAAGKATWVGQLDQGVSREDVFQGFAQSNEFGAICANYGIIR